MFKKFPVQELQCPRGLQEPDFLSLLRSTFPQLAADKPFDVFTSDRSRRLHPLRVKTLTPEEICRTIRSMGAGNSALYIRLKVVSFNSVLSTWIVFLPNLRFLYVFRNSLFPSVSITASIHH